MELLVGPTSEMGTAAVEPPALAPAGPELLRRNPRVNCSSGRAL
jgi:hypothetical protein